MAVKQIEILDQAPIIFTKDTAFIDRIASFSGSLFLKPGRIILLPEDAILIRAQDEKKE